MDIFNSVDKLQAFISKKKEEGLTVGFVPTMGALHYGHLSLINASKLSCDLIVASIFVNPTQFNDHADYDKYPRTVERDIAKLNSINCDILFAPTKDEIYPSDYKDLNYKLGDLATVMEGKFRPGHFDGMINVVHRLLDIVKPNKAFFGQKDFQQLAIIRKMVSDYKLPIEIVGCPIIREVSGLAMSSRNERFSAEQRLVAANISAIMYYLRDISCGHKLTEAKEKAISKFNSISEFKLEYIDIVDGNTLQSIEKWEDTKYAQACCAVYLGEIRLIDNIELYRE